MFEDDVILPDDFQADTPQAEETPEETPVSEEVDTLETEQTEVEQQQEAERQAFLKVKYNSEEMDLDEQTARELAQKGLNYDKVQGRLQELESDPRLSFVEELAREQNMDVNEFLEAVRTAREEQQLNELVQQNIPEEYAKEMLENRKFREQQKAEQKAKEEEAAKNKEFGEFFEYFKQANGKDFDTKSDEIPQEVWDLNAQGIPLKFAYAQHENAQLRAQLQTLKQNETNKKRAPINGTTQYGSNEATSEDEFLKGFNSI
jgi:hypothetical protein